MKHLAKLLITILLLASCAGLNGVQYHQKLQEEANFESRLKENKSFTIKSLKDDVKTLSAKLRELEKQSGERSKIKSLETKLNELRTQIAELEKR